MLALLLSLLLPPAPVCGSWEAGDRSPPSVRNDAKRRVSRTARALGFTPEAVRVLRGMVNRESAGDPCAVHTLGRGEWGYGVLGLSVRWHLGKLDYAAPATVFQSPEISTIVAARIFRIAVLNHKARTWTALNSVFATGRVKVRPRLDAKFCALMERQGVDCESNPLGQLGRKLSVTQTPDQNAFLEKLTP